MGRHRILVVDDEHLIRWSLDQNLTKQGYEVITAESGEDALQKVQETTPDLVLLDIQLPGISGLEVLQRIKAMEEEILVIMITALDVVETAVKAMRAGAYDYISKPFNLDELAIIIHKTLETGELKREVKQLRSEKSGRYMANKMIGNSHHMQQVLDMVDKVAKSDASTVLIQGESGTGKELVAKALHYESSRASRPFMAINCAAVPETLLESELMGHEKGAFTDAKSQKKGLFEVANGGTLFLDEIGDMALGMQAKLLRVLEERSFRRVGGTRDIEIDVRIVSATNKDLIKAMEDQTFRTDLYYRIQVIPIYLPALRERREDILPLVEHFINHFNREFGKNVKGISASAAKMLCSYGWPGNVRELKNVIERAIILESDDTLKLEHLPGQMDCRDLTAGETDGISFVLPEEGADIEDVERSLIRQALSLCNGNQSQAAKKLNLGIDAFRYRMKKFELL